MGHGQPQYTMVTKQPRKSGCVAGFFHLIGGFFTFGLWPLGVWLSHRAGPKRKQVTRVYGPPVGPGQLYPPQYQQPYYLPHAPPQYGYGQPTMRQRPATGQQPTIPPPNGQSYRWDPVTQQWVTP